ncbi:MAG: hypothetical protein LAN84_00290 [Acidobacteriia bacterium]|nr:hypothetical protein [Terriglobia bacterium]
MPPIIPDVVPDHFPAGTTVKFTRSLGDFSPADGWAYTIYLNGLTQKFNKAATVLNNIFQIEFLPADTASLNPGPFRYAERLTNAGTGETYDITGDQLVINIEPNVGISAAGVFNTWEEKTLAIVEAAISGRLTADIQAYQIAGRSVSKIPIAELRTIRGELRAAIWRQNNPGQLGVPHRVAFTLEPESPDYPPTWQDVTGLAR